MRRLYGDGPLHLFAQLVAVAVAGYAASRVLVEHSPWVAMLVWFVGAALGHDLVLYPLYAIADVTAQFRPFRRTRPLPATDGVPWINYLRVPIGLSLLILLVWWPLILSDAPGTFTAATGLTTGVYLGRWLGITGVFLLVSGLAYAVQVRRAVRGHGGATDGGAAEGGAAEGGAAEGGAAESGAAESGVPAEVGVPAEGRVDAERRVDADRRAEPPGHGDDLRGASTI